MIRFHLLGLILILSLASFLGCKTGPQTREVQADLKLAQKKTPPLAATVKEDLKEPQLGYSQEPRDTLTA